MRTRPPDPCADASPPQRGGSSSPSAAVRRGLASPRSRRPRRVESRSPAPRCPPPALHRHCRAPSSCLTRTPCRLHPRHQRPCGRPVRQLRRAPRLRNDRRRLREWSGATWSPASSPSMRSPGGACTSTVGRSGTLHSSISRSSQALTFLAATELFRGQRDSAVGAFRQLVLLNPRYRPDELIFPPQVTNLFQEVRRATRAIAVAVPPVTQLRTRVERFTARVLASSLADVAVTLAREDGNPVRGLYKRPLAATALVPWDGVTAAAAPA